MTDLSHLQMEELTGITELDIEIATQLPLRSILNLSRVSKCLYTFTQNEVLWMRLVQREFEDEVLKYKSSSESFQNQYKRLRKLEDPFDEARKGRIDSLIVHRNKGLSLNTDIAWNATAGGNIKTLEWLYAQGIYSPNSDNAAENGHLHVLEWQEKRDQDLGTRTWTNAAMKGHIHILEWLEQRGPIDASCPYWAGIYGQLDTLKWLTGRGIFPNQHQFCLIIRSGHLDCVIWLVDHGMVPYFLGAQDAAMRGHRHILDWLAQRGILPDRFDAQYAAENGDLETLKWLADHKIYPYRNVTDIAYDERRHAVVEWILQQEWAKEFPRPVL